jgi:hypothetical protein
VLLSKKSQFGIKTNKMFSFFTTIILFYMLEKSVLFFADVIVFVFAKINKMYQTLVRFFTPMSKMITVG